MCLVCFYCVFSMLLVSFLCVVGVLLVCFWYVFLVCKLKGEMGEGGGERGVSVGEPRGDLMGGTRGSERRSTAFIHRVRTL